MQPTSVQPTPAKLHDWQILENVAPYLNISELIRTSTLSKEYNYTLRNYFKKHILPKNSLAGGQNELTTAKKLFHRQIKIVNITHPKQEISMIPNLILKDLQAGASYTLIQTLQGKKYMVKNSQLINKQFEVKTFVQLDKKYESKFVTLVGNSIFTASDNRLIRLALKQNEATLIQEDGDIMFDSQIIQVQSSQTHLCVVTQNDMHEHRLFAVHLKQFKSVEVLYQEEKQQTKHLQIGNLSFGANTAFYINNFKVFQLDVQNTKEPNLMKSFKDKQIRRIMNGAGHFFAVEKAGKLTSQWDTKDLIEWADKEGYGDYLKIFKAQKVTGNTLLNMNKRYMEDVLGILNVKVQQRLMVQIQQQNVEKQENCTVYGWGRNDKAQLGLNPSNPVSNPHKVTLQEGFSLMKCVNNSTFIHSKKSGKMCMNSTSEGKFEWQPVFNKVHNIWSVSMYKDLVMVLCPVEKDLISQQLSQDPVYHKKQKLRTAKNIIDKIQWDQNIDKNQFRIGYLDKYTGVLQITFEQLTASTEIKEYRIQYFKRNGEIVWSKKDRIDVV